MDRDLRSWMKELEDAGELRRVTARVDWDGEIAEVQHRNLQRRGPALLFNNIKGHKSTWCRQIFVGGVATQGRVALMFGMPKDSSRADMVGLLRTRMKHPVPPRIIDDAPVKQNIVKGQDVDLSQIPVPVWHALDGGRYINTWCGVVTMDPETGQHNVGLYRGVVLDRDKIGVLLAPVQHWGIHYGKYQRLGKAMPVAMVYGWDPVLVFTAGLPTALDEYGLMGAIRQCPVPLCKCETSDLMVPASAEIVIEGTISPDPASYEPEGPYGETPGHYAEAKRRPVMNVGCISFRNDPIYRGATTESGEMLAVGHSALVWDTLEGQGVPGILDVAASAVVAVKIRKTYQAQARQVASAIWGSRLAVTVAKVVIVVDEEASTDIHNPAALLGALSLYLDPVTGLVVFPMPIGTATDQSLSSDETDELAYGYGLQNKLLIDATVDWTTHPQGTQWGGRRLSPNCHIPSPRVAKLVDRRWHEYGLG